MLAEYGWTPTGNRQSGGVCAELTTLAATPETRATREDFDLPAVMRAGRMPPAIVNGSHRRPVEVEGIEPGAEYARPAVGWVRYRGLSGISRHACTNSFVLSFSGSEAPCLDRVA